MCLYNDERWVDGKRLGVLQKFFPLCKFYVQAVMGVCFKTILKRIDS